MARIYSFSFHLRLIQKLRPLASGKMDFKLVLRHRPASISLLGWLSFFLCTFVVFPKDVVGQETPGSHPALLQRFWDIGCEFSGVVTRVRRSTDNPPADEPNFDDPEELFNYLYPLAKVEKGDDGVNGESQRSTATGTHSISSWLEDLMELWHSECHQRREKRSAARRARAAGGGRRESGEGRLRRKEYAWLSHGKRAESRNSSLADSMRRQGFEDYSRDEDAILEDDDGNKDDDDYKEDEDGKDKDKDKDKLKPLLGAAVATAAGFIPPKPEPQKPVVNLPSMADNKKEDIFFAQYGGDIEYFFPLLSFGIPFDGEITLLGFHGFRGIFPY